MTTTVPDTAYEHQILDREKHSRMVMNIDYYADRAGISPHYIWTPAMLHLGPEELSYLRQLKTMAQTGCVGLFYEHEHNIVAHMSLMAGALVRAFVDARLMTAQEVVDAMTSGDEPDATALFIPNFHSASDTGKFDSRRIAALIDALYHRAATGQQTIIHIDNMHKAEVAFGDRLPGFLNARYLSMTPGK